jgi:hypothetical protein
LKLTLTLLVWNENSCPLPLTLILILLLISHPPNQCRWEGKTGHWHDFQSCRNPPHTWNTSASAPHKSLWAAQRLSAAIKRGEKGTIREAATDNSPGRSLGKFRKKEPRPVRDD